MRNDEDVAHDDRGGYKLQASKSYWMMGRLTNVFSPVSLLSKFLNTTMISTTTFNIHNALTFLKISSYHAISKMKSMASTPVAVGLARVGGTYKRINHCLVASFVIWLFFTLSTYFQVIHQDETENRPIMGLHDFKRSNPSTDTRSQVGQRIAIHDASSNNSTKIFSPIAPTKKTPTINSNSKPKINAFQASPSVSVMESATITRANVPVMLKVASIAGHPVKPSKVNPDFADNHNNTLCDVVYSYEDIKRCYPPNKRKNMTSFATSSSSLSCDSITTWPDVQHCLNGKSTTPARKSKLLISASRDYTLTIHLIGERNSGTKWVVEEMKKCFPREKFGLKIERDLFGRNKHFFQMTDHRWPTQRDHMVISIFRDPVEWVAAMIEKPYHMTEHMNGFDENDNPIPLDWQEFVQKPWSMKNRSQYDFRILEMKQKNPHKYLPCRSGLEFHEVMPCRFDSGTIPDRLVRTQNPVYELKRGGAKDEPYKTILELRSDKIVNFLLEVPLLQDLGGYLAVRFEDLLINGTRNFLSQVADLAGIKGGLPASCNPQGPKPGMIGRRKIPEGLQEWVEDNLILRTERLLGYR